MSACALGAMALVARPAMARTPFPDWLNEYVATADPSPAPRAKSIIEMNLCHGSIDRNSGAFYDRPFTHALRATTTEKLTVNSRTEFFAAIAAMDESNIDSDCDGFPDLDELRANKSPNTANSHPDGTPPQAPCPEPIFEPEPAPAPAPEGDDDDDDNGARPSQALPAASSCAVSSTGRPLDPSALFLTALVALPLTRRALRPRARRAGGV
ncbi:MAG TPA: hypothetical protein VFS43_01090 [Polyangiaceae bacterium]|nr:hypothetical protein [Polyangiaceae bacterium]